MSRSDLFLLAASIAALAVSASYLPAIFDGIAWAESALKG